MEEGEIPDDLPEEEEPAFSWTEYIAPQPRKPLIPSVNVALKLLVVSSPFLTPSHIIPLDFLGLTIGRDRLSTPPVTPPLTPPHLRLPELQISRHHCEISLKVNNTFRVKDLGSTHGTFLNTKRLSQPKVASDYIELKHLDILRVGSTSFEIHSHSSWGSCGACQLKTGNEIDVRSTSAPKPPSAKEEKVVVESRKEAHKKELDRLKKRILGSSEESAAKNKKQNKYTDRAALRRSLYAHTHEQYHEPELDQRALYHQEQEPDLQHSPGAHLLSKLGWKPGQSLGSASNPGILEPITATPNQHRQGLGISTESESDSVGKQQLNLSRRDAAYLKALARFKDASRLPVSLPHDDDDDDDNDNHGAGSN
ncbi:hypothetical protein HDV05_003908 [Chytridiales sp. JEL 0842]|nr:hypothetical protein HDV05_003908 [Chytridiales sp. JEL 0842]